MKWSPKWRDALDLRLQEWAKYHRVANDPGVGYDRVNLLRKIMKPNEGESVDRLTRRDWSPEERIDHALQVMQRIDPAMAYAVTIPALWPEPKLRGKYARKAEYWCERWNYVMRQAEPGWHNLTWKTYDGYQREGRAYLVGALLDGSGHAVLYEQRARA